MTFLSGGTKRHSSSKKRSSCLQLNSMLKRHGILPEENVLEVVIFCVIFFFMNLMNIQQMCIPSDERKISWICVAGKILVDVSNNRRMNQYPQSNAEYLASLLPESIVVKGFNVISAWSMQQNSPKDAGTQVYFNKRDSFLR